MLATTMLLAVQRMRRPAPPSLAVGAAAGRSLGGGGWKRVVRTDWAEEVTSRRLENIMDGVSHREVLSSLAEGERSLDEFAVLLVL